MSEILVIVAHPNIEASRVNKLLAKTAENIKNVTVHYLYDQYPDGVINVEIEQNLLVQANHIVLQFPMYWYSTPSLLKKWQDNVLTHGFAYGEHGKYLFGKTFSLVVSTGSPLIDYRGEGSQGHSVDEILLPLKKTAIYSNMSYQNSFVLGGSLTITDEELIKKSKQYRDYLLQMR